MTIKREILEAAASAGMLKYGQIDNLLVFLAQQELKSSRQGGPSRAGAALLNYLGGMLILGAALLFAYMAAMTLGIGALLWCSIVYAVGAIILANRWMQRGRGLLASLFAVLAVGMVCSAVLVAQILQGEWNGGLELMLAHSVAMVFDPRWLMLECAALATSIVLLCWLRLPFLLLPGAFSIWLIGMNLLPSLLMQSNSIAGLGFITTADEIRLAFTLVLGLSLIALGWYQDRQRRSGNHGFAVLAYFAGLVACCGTTWLLMHNLVLGKAAYAALHAGCIGLGVLLGRRIFAVFGGTAIALMIGQFTWISFRHSPSFVLVLTLTTMAMLVIAVWWWRHERLIAVRLRRKLPKSLKRLISRTA